MVRLRRVLGSCVDVGRACSRAGLGAWCVYVLVVVCVGGARIAVVLVVMVGVLRVVAAVMAVHRQLS